MKVRYLRARQVSEMVGASLSALYAWAKDPANPFPKPINLTGKREGLRWKESEVERYLAACERERDMEASAQLKMLRKAG